MVWLCPHCLALFPPPPPLWGGVVWLCPRPGPYCSSSDISGIIIIIIIMIMIIINGWYSLTRCIAGCCCPHPCGVVWLPRTPAPPCGVVWLCPRGPYCSSNVNTLRWEVSTVTRIGCV